MSIQRAMIFRSLVTPFYRKNAGLLCFVFFIMFLAVGRANGVGLLEYHYSLIRGLLLNPSFLVAVLAIWLAYALKCSQFITGTLRKPEFSYLYLLGLQDAAKIYWLLLQAQLVLFLPVWCYVAAVAGVGYHERLYMPVNEVLLFNIVICVVSACRYLYLLRNPGIVPFKINWKLPSLFNRKYYSGFLIRSILENNKLLFFAIKIYNCVTLFLMLESRDPAKDEDLRMYVLFFSIGMLGHGVFIHRLKEMENNQLEFYRGLPVSIGNRFAGYAWLYFCLFIPEIVTIATRTPVFLSYSEAFFFMFFGYGILLLLNSLQLYNYTGLKDYLKTVVQVFFAVIIAMVVRRLYELSILFFTLAVVLFFIRYYRFEPRQKNDL
jgi:hypothetical protein